MPSPKPEPLAPRPLTVWLVNPLDDIPGEGLQPLRTWTLARVLAGRGHEVTWWTSTWSDRRKAVRVVPPGVFEDEGFAVRLVAVRPYDHDASWAGQGSRRDFGRTFERLARESVASGQMERPDIILASLPPLEGSEAAARIAVQLETTFVLDVHDTWPRACERLVPGPEFVKRLLAPLLLGGMTRRRDALVRGCDGLAATAHRYAAEFLGEQSIDLPSHVCYVGAYPQEFGVGQRVVEHVPLPGADHAAASAGPPPLHCILVDEPEIATDLDTLVAAVRQLSAEGVRAEIHAIGAGRFDHALRRFTATGGSCRIEAHGFPSRQVYAQLLSRADVGLIWARTESPVAVPNAACDYAAAGLVVVNSLPGELRELILAHHAGVACVAGDAGSLARTLAELAANRRRLSELRQGARRLAAAEFDREKTYPRFVDWLETLGARDAGISRASA